MITSLTTLSHQEKALDFMIQRENGPIPDMYRLWKPHEREGLPWYVHTGVYDLGLLVLVIVMLSPAQLVGGFRISMTM
jgi:hypothetical protein